MIDLKRYYLKSLKKLLAGCGIVAVALVLFSTIGFGHRGGENVLRGSIKGLSLSPEQLFSNVSTGRKWVLIGDEFTGEENLELSVGLSTEFAQTCPQGQENVILTYDVLGTNLNGKLNRSPTENSHYSISIDVSGLEPGRYSVQIELSSACGNLASKPVDFNVSYPLYVAWTFDWEGYDVKQAYLNDIDELTAKHNNIPLTHFFNPRLYTTPQISKARQDYLTDWVKERRDEFGHAIGLHIHMFPDMVEAAGVIPHNDPAWGCALNDGYDILVSGYSYEDMVKILKWSKELFVQKGLGDPVMFRAGGWFADEGTLRVLQDSGFVLDSSGRAKYQFGTNAAEGHWDLNSTTKPYQPNIYDQNLATEPNLSLWEFPNNGADSWAYSADEMLQRFYDNFKGEPLSKKQIVVYLSHPEWFYKDKPKMDRVLGEIDELLYSADKGPVIYTTLEDAYSVWNGGL